MKKIKSVTSLMMVVLMVLTMFPTPFNTAFAETAGHVVISEAYGGGGNKDAKYKNDFIELYNPTSSDVDISGWKVTYASTTGTFNINYIIPEGIIKAGGYFLIKAAAGTGGTLDLPIPDATCNIAMGGSGFKLKIEKVDNDVITVVDFVGAGAANESEGGSPSPAPSNTTSVQRKDNDGSQLGLTNGWDTDNNGVDFYTDIPTPRNSQYGLEVIRIENPTANPASGEIEVGTEITLSVSTTGTSIRYNLNNGPDTDYTAPIKLNEDSFINNVATIKASASKEGMTSSDEVTFAYTKKAPLSIITTSEAKTKQTGTEVRIKGIVTYSTQARTIFMQDSSGGICIDKSGATLSGFVGKEIVVTGKIALYGGMVQVTPANLSDITVTNEKPILPEPLVITVYDLMNTDRVHEGKLIKIENAQISVIGGTATGTFNHKIAQGSVETTLRTQALYGKVVGDYVTITGVAGYFNSPQIQANVTDIVDGLAPSVEIVTASPATNSILPAGSTITLSTVTEGATIKYTLNGGSEQTIDSNTGTVTINEFNQEGNKAVITAKAIKDDYTTPEATFTYTQANTQMVTASSKGAVAENTQVMLNASENAQIKYSVTIKAGLPEESTSAEVTYLEPISINVENLPIKITAYAIEEGYLNSDSTTFDYYLASNEPYKNYFGQLHSHTAENSDGAGTLVEAYTYARNNAKLDFFAVTDHSNAFDAANTEDKAGTYNLVDYNKNNTKWQNGLYAAANALTEDFICVYGYEMTWSGGPGHINTFATDGFVSRNNKELNTKTNDVGLKAYYELLKSTPNSISQFNHPGTTFGNFSDFAYLDSIIDARISLIEVGNGEGGVGSGAYFPSYEEYTKALDKGWHLAPTNNQDNHKKLWGNSNTARTVIYANDLSVQGLYDALREMRVYATEDNNLDIVYTLNDEMLGTIVETVPELAEFSITVKDPDSSDVIESVSIISTGGKEVLSKEFDSNEAIFEDTIENPAAGYYYVKVVQEDGHIAVTAPVWLGSAPKIGIDSVVHDKMMPATNEEMTFTTKIFNNESEAAKVKTVKYEIKGGSTLETYEINEDIAGSGGMYTHNHKHTFTKPGIFTLTVTVVLSQNGTDVTYSKDLDVNVRDSEKLVLVGIDASHNNEYVSGNYKDSMTNFGKLAAKYNVRTVELKTSEELKSALENPKYEMMIFTVPSRRDGTIGRIPFKSYSDSEIQAVSEFAKSGKTVIVTGWGDYYEGYKELKANPSFTADQHMAAQQNKLLEAIGSNLRLADDEAKDDTLNGGQAQRLYLTDYNNYVDPFTEGVVDGQIYSQYGVSTIFAVGSDSNAVNTLPSNIYPTISGHETTYSSDDDKDGNPVPPKYNDRVLLMANETITHDDGTTSTVVAAGGAFMSNFEIQVEVENAGTLPYSNYNILENIILTLRSVSDISDVHDMPIGADVIIEGIATTDVFNGSDSNKGFFDCIYVQDSTGGINLFPVASGVEAGQKIRVLGKVGEYQGEKQVQVEKVSVLDSDINLVEPISVTPQESMSPEYTGSLVKFKGAVSEIIKDNNGVVGQLIVGGARVYVNGYITKNVSLANIKVGDTVEVTGIASIGENMSSLTEFLPRIRVRDRAEIVFISSSGGGSNKNTPITKDTVGTVELSKDVLNKATDKVTVTTSIANISFDKLAAEHLAENSEGNVMVTAKLVDKNALSYSLRKAIGDRPVYSFTVSDKSKDFSSFGNGKITITVPYHKAADEVAENIIIYYVNENGQLETINYCEYNNGYISFITTHLSTFTVGYIDYNFKDVPLNSWYDNAVNFVSSRNLFTGIGEQLFDPNGSMTRAMFVTVLSRLDDIELSKYKTSQFKDVDIESWYGESVAWAVDKGIVKGYDDNQFGPNDYITREQMAVMLQSYIEYKGLDIEGISKTDFADSDKISSWAKSSVQAMQSYGLINGVGNNNFDPLNFADRASVSTIFMNFIKTLLR